MSRVLILIIFSLIFSVRSFGTAPISGLDSLCVGASTTLSDTDPGGIWSSSTPAVATVGTDGTVIGVAAGTSLISYTVGGSSATMVMLVKATPSATITIYPPDSVCFHTPVTLSATVTGIIDHSADMWLYYGTVYLGTGDTFVYVPSPLDSFTYEYIGISQCSGLPDTVVSSMVHMMVKAPPMAGIIAGASSICAGVGTISLSDSPAGGTWIANNASASVSGGIVAGVTGGVDTIRYCVANSCGTDTASHVIDIIPIPHPTVSTPCCSVPNLYLSYQWYQADHTILPGATGYWCSDCGMGAWYVVVDSGGCTGTSDTGYVYEGVNSVNVQKNIILLYPNPVTTSLTVTSSEKITNLIVTNLFGQTVYDHRNNSEKVEVDVSDWPPGVYLVTVNAREVRTFLKE